MANNIASSINGNIQLPQTTKPDMIRNLTKTVIIVHPGFHESQKGRFVREDKPRAASKLPFLPKAGFS